MKNHRHCVFRKYTKDILSIKTHEKHQIATFHLIMIITMKNYYHYKGNSKIAILNGLKHKSYNDFKCMTKYCKLSHKEPTK